MALIDVKFQLVALQETHPVKQFLVFVPYVRICGLYLNQFTEWMGPVQCVIGSVFPLCLDIVESCH